VATATAHPEFHTHVGNEFDQFVQRRSPELLRTAYLLTGDRGHAEDLLQTTLIRTARRWRAARAAPDAYARRVLVNLSRDRRRGLSRRPAEAALDEPNAAQADVTDQVAERDAVSRAVIKLPERQREVVALRFYLDLSVAETAAALRCSEGTVKSYTSRALATLKTALTQDEGVPDGRR
jgi:RNA polymerase sigma-70 factor (sigma-E family)